MSKKRAHARTRNRSNLERAYTPSMSNAMGIQGDYAKYGGGNSVTIPTNVLVAMLQNQAPQKNKANDFAPGSPLTPYPGVVPLSGPRITAYPISWNINPNDRSFGFPDIPSFQQLRNFAMLYEAVAICERVVLDLIPKLQPRVTLTKAAVKAGAEEDDFQDEISQWMKFIEMPDPAQKMDIHTWLRMAWIEQTQIDALALYKQRTRGGKLYGLQILDGSLIKPLVDERGMIPQPPYPAYQQYPYGVPGDEYTTDQMLYYRESPRAYTPYGFSRIERIIMRVNQALRKEQKDLARWTEGNIPASIIEVPADMNWTPDQIDDFEQRWNALLAGNYQQQVRAKFLQAGMKYNPIDDVELNTPFDEFLLNLTAASYGLSMQDLAFTGDIHKSSGDSQQNVMYRRTLYPFVSVYARMLTTIQRENTGVTVLEYDFGGFDEVEDQQAIATTLTMYTNAGVLGLSNAAKLAKLPEDPNAPHIGRVFMSKDGPIFLDDMASDKMRNAAADAKMAGFQLAAHPPEPTTQQEEEGEGDSNEKTAQGADTPESGKGATSPKTGTKAATGDGPAEKDTADHAQRQERSSHHRGYLDGDISGRDTRRAPDTALRDISSGAPDGEYGVWRQGTCQCDECQQNNGRIRRSGEPYPSGATAPGTHDGCDCTIERVESPQSALDRLVAQVEALLARLDMPRETGKSETVSSEQDITERDIAQELNRWRDRAVDDMKKGRTFRGFTTTIISEAQHTRIESALLDCQTTDDVRAVFRAAKERKPPHEGDLASSIAALFADVEARGSRELTA